MRIIIDERENEIHGEIMFDKKGVTQMFSNEYAVGTNMEEVFEELMDGMKQILNPEYEG